MSRSPYMDGFWVLFTGAGAILVTLSPVGASTTMPAGPNWLFLVMAYWCARRPSAPGPVFVFALGLTQDMLRSGPIGAELFALLLICELLRNFSESRPPLGFLMEWLRFAGALLAFEAIVLVMLTATYADPPEAIAIAERVGLSILAYPVLSYLLEKLFRARGRGRFDHLRF